MIHLHTETSFLDASIPLANEPFTHKSLYQNVIEWLCVVIVTNN